MFITLTKAETEKHNSYNTASEDCFDVWAVTMASSAGDGDLGPLRHAP